MLCEGGRTVRAHVQVHASNTCDETMHANNTRLHSDGTQ